MVFQSLRDLIRPDKSRPALVVDGVTETFRLYHEKGVGLKERLYRLRRVDHTDFNALEAVSFTVQHGETLGIIGHNGSGKSTLLKLLARILPPDEGEIEVNGRVATLLELGAGFHGDLTGRENVYLNGAILGLTRGEIDNRFDDIVDFAGVRPFLDTPVRNYSSGMYVRLGFAIAVHVDPDILLVDEVLSVGDAQFQSKSLERMKAFQERGKTVVLVSHDLGSIEDLCDRVLLLEQGRLIFDGPVREGVQLYSQLMAVSTGDRDANLGDRVGSGEVRIQRASLIDGSGTPVHRLSPSSVVTLRIVVEARQDVRPFSVGAIVRTGDARQIYEVHTTWQGLGVGPLSQHETAVVDIRLAAHLLAGHYTITPIVTDANGKRTFDAIPAMVTFEIEPAPGGTGLVDMQSAVSVADGPAVNLDVTGRDDTGPIPVVAPEEAPEGATSEAGDESEARPLRAIDDEEPGEGGARASAAG